MAGGGLLRSGRDYPELPTAIVCEVLLPDGRQFKADGPEDQRTALLEKVIAEAEKALEL